MKPKYIIYSLSRHKYFTNQYHWTTDHELAQGYNLYQEAMEKVNSLKLDAVDIQIELVYREK